MQEYQQLVPDAEMFARVWKRVMPDESGSPIVVHPPEGERKEPKPPRTPPKPVKEEREWLREVLAEMEEGAARVGEILRRDPGAWPLRDSMGKSAAQLKAAWFLLTGERWRNAGRRQPVGGSMEALLREQYLRELRFSELCRQAGEHLRRGDLAEIMSEQEDASSRRRRMLRHMLAGGR
jgi:hypothetical protein